MGSLQIMGEYNIPVINNDFNRESDKVLLFGKNSVGKSFCIASLLKPAKDTDSDYTKELIANRRVIYVMCERNAVSGLKRGLEYYGVTVEEGQLLYVFPKRKEKTFTNMRRAVGAYQKETKTIALTGKKDVTVGKETYSYFDAIFACMENFKGIDYATGKEVILGNIGDLDISDILVVDGLSPIYTEVWKVTQGDKIAISQNDFMPAQYLMNDIMQNLGSIEANVILMAHSRDLTDTAGNLMETVVNTGVGQSTYSTLMGCFSEIVHCYRFGTKYLWECEKPKVACNSRKLPKETGLVPDFSLYNLFGNIGTYVEK
jgi:hypothetical protein